MKLFAKTITELSGLVGEDRHALSAALAEPDAPQKRKRGWAVQAVRDYLFIRRLEKMSGPDFEAMCQSVEGEGFDPEYFFDADSARSELEAIRQQGRLAYIKELRGEP